MKLKQYKLKRDLPTFKAGSEFIVCCGNLIEVKTDGTLGVCAYSGSTLKKFPNILTDWFEEIKPAEPLIKDEKIRKAVRAWAEANRVTEARYSSCHDAECEFNARDDENKSIVFIGNFTEMNKELDYSGRTIYTIDELCGEEKE